MNLNLILFFLIFFLFQNFEKESNLFNNYLIDNYKISIPNKQTSYLIISLKSCVGCKKKLLAEIETNVKEKDNVTIIFSFLNKTIPNEIINLSKWSNVLLDKKDKISQIDFNASLPLLIRTKNKSIISIDTVDYLYFSTTLRKIL